MSSAHHNVHVRHITPEEIEYYIRIMPNFDFLQACREEKIRAEHIARQSTPTT